MSEWDPLAPFALLPCLTLTACFFFFFFLGSKGDMGMKGDTGVMGPPGAQGSKGDSGQQGPPGKGLPLFSGSLSLRENISKSPSLL
jgi:hypothetical protein